MSCGSPKPGGGSGGNQSANNTYQSVHPLPDSSPNHHNPLNTSVQTSSHVATVANVTSSSTPCRPPQDLLKRSPVLRDVVAGFTPIQQRKEDSALSAQWPTAAEKEEVRKADEAAVKERLHAPLTIIIPHISNQAVTKSSSNPSPDKWSERTISLDILNPGARVSGGGCGDLSGFSGHDYENLALVNVNREQLGHHWRTYSDMANSRHDDSTKYERNKLNFTSSSDYRYKMKKY